MKLFVLVLNKTDALDELLSRFAADGICGSTIIDSTGMVQELWSSGHDEEDISFLSGLRSFMDGNESRSGNKTIFCVIRDDQLDTVTTAVTDVVGDLLGESNTGIMFSIPLDYVCGKGLNK